MRTSRGALALLVAATLLAAPVTVACSSGDDSDDDTDVSANDSAAAEMLAEAKSVLDDTASVHLVLDGENLGSAGTVLKSAEGTVVGPDGFEGEFEIAQSGFGVTVPVVATDGTVWAQLPLSSSWTEVDPEAYGLPDPSAILDPDSGLSALLVLDSEPTADGQTRLGDEVLELITADVPGAELAEAIPVGAPTGDVSVEFGIETDSGELRLARLVGAFYGGSADQTYRLVLDDYGAEVVIEPPTDG